MNIHNLLLKFLLLALVLVLCLWSLNCIPGVKGPGLREGLDLAGGYELTFSFETPEAEIEALRLDIEAKQAQLAEATDDETRATLAAELQGLQGDMEELERRFADLGDITPQMVEVLKNRLDPNGLLSLQFLPLRGNRICIRMPAPRPETIAAEQDFLRSMEALGEYNVTRGQLRALRSADAADQPAMIDALAGDNDVRRERLVAMLAAYEAQVAARLAYEGETSDPTARRQARFLLAQASDAYSAAEDAVLATNVNLETLRSNLMTNFVTEREERQLRREPTGEQKLAMRRAALDNYLTALRESHPLRVEGINAAVNNYERWARLRQSYGDPSTLRRLIRKAGMLEFRIAPQRSDIPADELAEMITALEQEGPEVDVGDYRWLPTREDTDPADALIYGFHGDRRYMLLHDTPEHTMLADRTADGWRLTSARETMDQNSRPAVSFTLDDNGSRLFARITGDHVQQHMAILLDNEVYNAPVIQTRIAGAGLITLTDPRERPELVRTLRSGSLPAMLNPEPVSEKHFGPALGAENKRLGLEAGKWSLIAVAAFMLAYYLWAGAIADVALMVNLILLFGFMSLFQVVLTLPGVFGLLLTIGIAVDANVLIFERLREEQRKGQPLGMTVSNAYRRALSAIFDANITTLITCLILGWIGTVEVRGFAITLGLGVAFSMFSALVVSRWLFQLLMNLRIFRDRVRMAKVIGTPKVNWIGKRYLFWGLSVAMIVMGVVSLVREGDNVLGIEFSSGTQVTVHFDDDAMLPNRDGELELLNDGLVMEATQDRVDLATMPEARKFLETARIEPVLISASQRTADFLAAHDTNQDGSVSLAEWDGNEAFFAAISSDGQTMTEADLRAKLPTTTYTVTTTEVYTTGITEWLNVAFPTELRSQAACPVTFLTEAPDTVDIPLDNNGMTLIQWEDASGAPTAESDLYELSNYRDLLREFNGGVLYAIELEDENNALTAAAVERRITEMHYQPDFADHPLSSVEVVGLGEADSQGRYGAFLVFALPDNVDVLETANGWYDYAVAERALIIDAMNRMDSLEMINFDAPIAAQARSLAIIAIVLSCVAIVLYLWLRFGSLTWGLAAVTCLAHDVIIVVGLVAASGWMVHTAFGRALGIEAFKIDLAMVAAFLTVIGYSVNDTIVVFDRIRENRGRAKDITPDVINRSINQTLSRTLLTSTTTLIVVLIMYVRGGPGIHAFSFALLAGVLFGTYSSIAVASPLLLGIRKALVSTGKLADDRLGEDEDDNDDASATDEDGAIV
jgi:SecD/SecF fusion protein